MKKKDEKSLPLLGKREGRMIPDALGFFHGAACWLVGPTPFFAIYVAKMLKRLSDLLSLAGFDKGCHDSVCCAL